MSVDLWCVRAAGLLVALGVADPEGLARTIGLPVETVRAASAIYSEIANRNTVSEVSLRPVTGETPGLRETSTQAIDEVIRV